MCQTLFVIPSRIAGIDVFGFGWQLAIWAVISAAMIGWSFRHHGWSSETRGQIGAVLVVALGIAFSDAEPDGRGTRWVGHPRLRRDAARGGGGRRGAFGVRAKRVGLNPEIILSLGTWFFIWGIVGARAFYVIEYWDRFQKETLGRDARRDRQPDARRAGRVRLAAGRRRGAGGVHSQVSFARVGVVGPDRPGRGAGHGPGAAGLLHERLLLWRLSRRAMGRAVSAREPGLRRARSNAAPCTCMG